MQEIRNPAELLDANPEERLSYFGDLQVQANRVEVFAEPNIFDQPHKQVATVAAAVKESGALQGHTLQLIETLFDALAEERQRRSALEARMRVLESALLPAEVAL
jgi:hypothetical protein